MRCIKCGRTENRRSRRKFWERPICFLFGVRIFRCGYCEYRFWSHNDVKGRTVVGYVCAAVAAVAVIAMMAAPRFFEKPRRQPSATAQRRYNLTPFDSSLSLPIKIEGKQTIVPGTH